MVSAELDGVERTYGRTTALDGVDLQIEDGEFFTLLGPSGCGKTTTLRLLAGFEEPTTGAVRLAGESTIGVPPEDRDVGVVFQSYALFPHMTVRENVGYGLRFAAPPVGQNREERVDDLLDLVDLHGMGDRRPETLSGGQQQRVALARALAPEPRLLLLDEPMSALDARLRERLRLQVRTVQEELGITTVYVTHDQEEALAISDRVAVMNGGRVEQVGSPREVYRRPQTRFVAEFVGDNNVFEGEAIRLNNSDSGQETEGSRAAGGRASVADGRPADPPGTTDETAVAVGDRTFRLPATDAAVGDRVTFCVRPQHLCIAAGENRFKATVESAEYLGEATRVHLDWDGRPVRLRTDRDVADEVDLGFDPENAHVIPTDRTGHSD